MTSVDYGVLSAVEPFKNCLKIAVPCRPQQSGAELQLGIRGGGAKNFIKLLISNKTNLMCRRGWKLWNTILIERLLSRKILYKDGERRYILATKNMKVGDEIISAQNHSP